MKEVIARVCLISLFLSFSALGASKNHYDWNNRGNCYEYKANGERIRIAARRHCRQVHPTHFAWDDFGKCFERTPKGHNIKIVSPKLCQRSDRKKLLR